MTHFTDENTQGYTANQLAEMNRRAGRYLSELASDIGCDVEDLEHDHSDAYKAALERCQASYDDDMERDGIG